MRYGTLNVLNADPSDPVTNLQTVLETRMFLSLFTFHGSITYDDEQDD